MACGAAILGNMVPVPFIMLLIRRIFDWLRQTALFGPKIEWLERRAHLKGRLVRKYRLPGLIILVAIPLPGTGAWTGALVAALLDIRMRHGGDDGRGTPFLRAVQRRLITCFLPRSMVRRQKRKRGFP